MRNEYKATLFHPAGDFVTDFDGQTSVNDVWHKINDMGSRWIFYPLCFVTTDKTVIAAPDGLEFLQGKRIKTVKKYLENSWKNYADEICEYLNNGYPLNHIYPEI